MASTSAVSLRITLPIFALTLAMAFPAAAQPAPRGPAGPPPSQQPPAATEPAPPKPYKAIAVTPPSKTSDASLDAFRKEIAGIAARKDRAALASRTLAKGFVWERADAKKADPRKSGIDHLAEALNLGSQDGSGWQALIEIVDEPNAAPFAGHQGLVCAPAGPSFDENQLDQLAAATQTDPMEWTYPPTAGLEVRDKPAANAAVIEKLGLHLVRVMEESDSAAGSAEWVRVVTPSGKVGFVRADGLHPLSADQICYAKEGNAWKIAGFVGGGGD